jgi:hypothetical protein
MNDEVERIWKEGIMLVSKYYSEIRLEGLRKTTTDLSRNSKDPPPEYVISVID